MPNPEVPEISLADVEFNLEDADEYSEAKSAVCECMNLLGGMAMDGKKAPAFLNSHFTSIKTIYDLLQKNPPSLSLPKQLKQLLIDYLNEIKRIMILYRESQYDDIKIEDLFKNNMLLGTETAKHFNYIIGYVVLSNAKNDAVRMAGEIKRRDVRTTELLKSAEADYKIVLSTKKQAETMLADLSIQRYSTVYKIAADKCGEAAQRWLVLAASLFLCTLLAIGLIVLFAPPHSEHLSDMISGYINRVVVVSLLTMSVLWASKNYNLNMHNMYMYNNKHYALSTYLDMNKAVMQDTLAKAMIRSAIKYIFRYVPTGYYNKNEVSLDIPSIVKSTASPSKKEH